MKDAAGSSMAWGHGDALPAEEENTHPPPLGGHSASPSPSFQLKGARCWYKDDTDNRWL